MPVEAAPTPDSPAWLVWATAVAAAAFLGVAAGIVGRLRRGVPVVEPRPRRPVPWEGSDVLFVIGSSVALATLVGGLIGKDPPVGVSLQAGLVLMSAAGLAAIGWLTLRGGTASDLGLMGGRLGADLALATAGLGLVLVPLLALASALNQLVPYKHDVVDFLNAHRDPWAVGLVIAAAVVAAPLVEELFFRRILQGWLEKRLPAADGAAAIVISAAAFALAHQGQGLAFVPLFPLGLVLGFIARQTGSIVPCILLHALFNAVSVGLLLATPPALPAG
jgi:membrane protease YdiL (CAAX protease family)